MGSASSAQAQAAAPALQKLAHSTLDIVDGNLSVDGMDRLTPSPNPPRSGSPRPSPHLKQKKTPKIARKCSPNNDRKSSPKLHKISPKPSPRTSPHIARNGRPVESANLSPCLPYKTNSESAQGGTLKESPILTKRTPKFPTTPSPPHIQLESPDTEEYDDVFEHNWNVDSAIKMYQFFRHPEVPPAGPLKNAEPMKPAGGGKPGLTVTVGQDTLPTMQNATPSSPSSSLARKLKRGLSKTSENMLLVNKARDDVLNDIQEDRNDHAQHFVETSEYTFVLPDLTVHSEDFRAFLHKDLIETSTLVSLEQAGRLNWWADMCVCQRLLPMATTGDGNCLLHAASLGMWGFHDRLLTLRKALFTTLNNCREGGPMWRRWRWHQTQINKQSGLIYTDAEWREEWQNILKLASTKPRILPGAGGCCNSPATKGLMERAAEREVTNSEEVFYESLEEFHVFVLAHVLRRPVLVVADTVLRDSHGEALAPIPFGGIYLPFEVEPAQCHRAPMLLTYDASHFSALVAMEHGASSPSEQASLPTAIPVVDPEFNLLPVHYMHDPGPMCNWSQVGDDTMSTEERLQIMSKYMDLKRLSLPHSPLSEEPDLLLTRPEDSISRGSTDSDDTGTKDKGDKGKKGKNSMAKSFGNFGKQMKKLTKIGGKESKGGKNNDDGKERQRRRSSIGSATQSTKVSSITEAMVGQRDHILCVPLSPKRPEHQNEMVQNYLRDAHERFQADRSLRSQQDVEIRQRMVLMRQVSTCINPGCNETATASTSYLCKGCYEKEKQQALDFEKRPVSGDGSRTGTMVTSGKSRFYTLSDEEHGNSAKSNSNPNLSLNNIKPGPDPKAAYYDRTPSPGPAYENRASHPVPPGATYIVNKLHDSAANDSRKYGTLPSRLPSHKNPGHSEVDGMPPPQNRPPADTVFPTRQAAFKVRVEDDLAAKIQKEASKGPLKQQPCRGVACQFYGTEATDYLCSSCYKEMKARQAFTSSKTGLR